jgi:hypothetical protein
MRLMTLDEGADNLKELFFELYSFPAILKDHELGARQSALSPQKTEAAFELAPRCRCTTHVSSQADFRQGSDGLSSGRRRH